MEPSIILAELKQAQKEYKSYLSICDLVSNKEIDEERIETEVDKLASIKDKDVYTYPYMNILTHEHVAMKVSVNKAGWYILRKESIKPSQYFESFESLMFSQSGRFQRLFHQSLSSKLHEYTLDVHE